MTIRPLVEYNKKGKMVAVHSKSTLLESKGMDPSNVRKCAKGYFNHVKGSSFDYLSNKTWQAIVDIFPNKKGRTEDFGSITPKRLSNKNIQVVTV